ncbi:MAG: hypothetical protein U0930_02395 [Pirellulales bacterium]
MIRIHFRKFFAVTVLTLSSSCYAHEGHGHSSLPGNSPSHYLTEPLHLAQFVGIALAVLFAGGFVLKSYFSRNRDQLRANSK